MQPGTTCEFLSRSNPSPQLLGRNGARRKLSSIAKTIAQAQKLGTEVDSNWSCKPHHGAAILSLFPFASTRALPALTGPDMLSVNSAAYFLLVVRGACSDGKTPRTSGARTQNPSQDHHYETFCATCAEPSLSGHFWTEALDQCSQGSSASFRSFWSFRSLRFSSCRAAPRRNHHGALAGISCGPQRSCTESLGL